MATAKSPTGGGELMSSIAAVRQLLLQDYPSASHRQRISLADKLSAVQQTRYEEKLKFEEERKAHQEVVDDLKRRVEQAKREAQQEKSIRLTLEETNDTLEKHKDELSAQLDSVLSSSQAPRANENRSTTMASSEQVKTLERENEVLAAKLSATRTELEEMRKSSGEWKIQCLASQRQAKELQIELESYRKQYEASQDRQKELLQGRDTNYETFQKRLKESIAARKRAEEELSAIADANASSGSSKTQTQGGDLAEIHRKYEQAVAAKNKAEEKISRLEVELAALKRGKSEEEIELEQEKKEKVKQKIVSLTASLDKMKGQAHALQKEIKKLEDAASSKVNADELKKKKEALSMATAKEGAVLESIEVELKEKLALAKVKMEDCSAEFNRTRHELQAAKETVTSIQSEVIECQRKLKELSKETEEPSPEEKALGETEMDRTPAPSPAATPTKKGPVKKKAAAAKGKTVAKKRASTDAGVTANKRKKAK